MELLLGGLMLVVVAGELGLEQGTDCGNRAGLEVAEAADVLDDHLAGTVAGICAC